MTATATTTSATVAWAAVAGAFGYRIERRSGGSTDWTPVGEAGLNATSFTDGGLAADASYSYRVVAYNSRGDSSASATATTRTKPWSAGLFVQGTAYFDLDGDGRLDHGESYLAGATIRLYTADGATLLGATTTDQDGYYRFDDGNVAGGRLLPGTYRVVETPPAGVVSIGAQTHSNLDSGTVIASNTVQVTLVGLDDLMLTLNRSGVGEAVGVAVDDVGQTTLAGQLDLWLFQGPTFLSQFVAACGDLFHSVDGGDTFAVLPQTTAAAFGANGGRIANLYNHYGYDPAMTASQAAALQIALWELEIDSTVDLGAGAFRTTTNGVTPATLAAAQAFLAESAGKDEAALFFDATLGGQVTSTTGRQGMIAGGSVDFGNAVATTTAAAPTGSIRGAV